jgi:outer membrane receptor protein involved in Fe transport
MRRSFAVALFASSVSLPVFAQTAPDEGPANDSEIIVTAQKRDERQIDVPITLTAVTQERLREIGVSDLDELSNYVPGLNIQEQSANNPGIVIRGITSDSGSAQESPRVTLYYNGVDISRSRGSYQDVYDVERIEVVKGPQATLFGTASAIGAISIISARPKDGFSGELGASYGNFSQYSVSGHLNAGSDRLAGRVAFAYKRRDGYVRNIADSRSVPNQSPAGVDQSDLNGQNQLGIRASVRWKPTDDAVLDVIGTYDRQRNPGTAFISGSLPTTAGPANPFGVAELGGSPFGAAVLGRTRLGLTRDVYDVNATLTVDFADRWVLTLVNGYRKFNSLEVFDADGSAAPFLEFAEDADGWQASQETRFAYTSDTFRGSFGFNIFHEEGSQAVPFSTEEGVYLQCAARLIPGLACVAPGGAVASLAATAILTGGAATSLPYSSLFRNDGDNDSYSVFADATYIPTPSLELTAGVRALIEKRRSGFFARQPNSVISRAPLLPIVDTAGQTFTAEDSFQAILPRFNILYRVSPNINGYATVSKGRRSPIVQLSAARGPVPALTSLPSENVWNYEVGLKGSRNGISASVGVFYQVYDNFQVNVVEQGRAVSRNAGSAKNFGVEAEARAQIIQGVTLFGNIGYIDAKIDNKASNGTFAGNRFRLQPKLQASGGITIDRDLGNGLTVFATPSVTYRSQLFFEVPNRPLISQSGVTLVNLKAGVRFGEGRFEIAGFARNLTNKDYLLDAGNTGGAFGIPTFIPAEPRFYGVEARAKF